MLRSLRQSTLLTALALGSLVAQIAAPAHAAGIIRITEVMSNSTVANSAGSIWNGDWFELTNYGDAAVDITGWKVDDNSFAFGSSLPLNGITSIAANESVMFTENAGGVNVTDFKTFWGLGTSVQVGYYSGSGIGLSSSGDGVVIYTSGSTEINRVICEETLKLGGSVVHHHGMGKARTPWIREEYDSSYYILERLKRAFDPNDVMNKGCIIPP